MGKMLDTPQRLRVEGVDTFGFAAIAGRSQDGDSVQILISNYAIPADFKLLGLKIPAELLKPGGGIPDLSKVRSLPPRDDITYRDNAGYNLTVNNLPWGKTPFSVKRYRINQTLNLDLVEERSGSGGNLTLSSPLAPDAVELIILHRR